MICNQFRFPVDINCSDNLQAGKPNQSCVHVTWTKKESGACFVKYIVNFKDRTEDVIYTKIGYNIGEVQKCGIPSSVTITAVELKITFKSNTRTFHKKVLETAMPTTKAPATTAKPAGNYEMLVP